MKYFQQVDEGLFFKEIEGEQIAVLLLPLTKTGAMDKQKQEKPRINRMLYQVGEV